MAGDVADWRSLTIDPEEDLFLARNGRLDANLDHGAEIVAQSARFDYCFTLVLSLTPLRHPDTFRLIALAMLLGGIHGCTGSWSTSGRARRRSGRG